MKISCQSCAAKYTIADEKVVGKVVKIRCKKCGATIVINGNEAVPSAAAEPSGAHGNVFDFTGQPSSVSEQWTVNVADGDQRTMAVPDIISEYRAGVINDDTYCWKDGMSDWLPLRDIAELHTAVTLGPRPTLTPEIGGAQEDVAAASGGGLGNLFGGTGLSSPPSTGRSQPPAYADANGNGAAASLFGGGAGAARRAGGRAGGVDLFAGVEHAGAEDDVMTSAPASMPQGGDGMQKLTGQRNENSVLFSLAALTKGAPQEESSKPNVEGSGLIDIRALSAAMGDSKKSEGSSRADDIMNLAGGGAFSPALAAPVLAPPPLDASDAGVAIGGAAPAASNKPILFAAIGAVGLVAAAIIFVFGMRKPDAPAPEPTQTAAAIATPPAGEPVRAAEPAALPAAAADPAAQPVAAAAPVAAAPGTGAPRDQAAPRAAAPKAAANAGGGAVAAAAPAAAPAPAPAPAPAKPKSFDDALRAAAGAKDTPNTPAATAGGDKPFDRGAAAAALGAAASSAQACKKSDGPTGNGHVKVTFAPNGSVTTVDVDAPPYSGTAVGGCVAAKFRAARVPPFSGSPVSVGKSFTIN